MEFATQKDIERANGLDWRGHTFGYALVAPNASKMAKLIKNPSKLIARLEAVASRWDSNEAVLPFMKRILEIMPDSKYASAISSGNHCGHYSMSPGRPYKGDVVERICYNVAFSEGRLGNSI